MLKALGIGKSKKKLASDEQLTKYRDQKLNRDLWKGDLEQIQAITSKLGEEYASHKGDFAIGRYEQLKGMIKNALNEYEEALKAHKENENKALNEKVANRYGGQRSHVATKLKDSAAGFATGQDAPCELMAKQVEEDTEIFRKDVIQLKQNFRMEKTKLDKLGTDYETSKKHAPNLRYTVLKQMIKDITRSPT